MQGLNLLSEGNVLMESVADIITLNETLPAGSAEQAETVLEQLLQLQELLITNNQILADIGGMVFLILIVFVALILFGVLTYILTRFMG